jgi:drug/metabolite transporter (DMT)-like permease
MGFFDALASSVFKTASDGSRLFSPLGHLGRGYVIASERDYQRLRRQMKIYFIILFVLIIGAGFLLNYFLGVGNTYVAFAQTVIALSMGGSYGVWAWSLCRRLQPSNDTLSGRWR